jgi:predicted site-specific integrase-resolvase
MSSLWTVKETAEFFKVTTKCIDNWCNEGKLEKKRLSGIVRITEDSIKRFIDSSN